MQALLPLGHPLFIQRTSHKPFPATLKGPGQQQEGSPWQAGLFSSLLHWVRFTPKGKVAKKKYKPQALNEKAFCCTARSLLHSLLLHQCLQREVGLWSLHGAPSLPALALGCPSFVSDSDPAGPLLTGPHAGSASAFLCTYFMLISL